MEKNLSKFLVCAAVIVSLAAGVNAQSIGINFGADEPDPADPGNSSSVDGPAGLVGTATWNNMEGASGGPTALVLDDGAASGATVEWVSPNTWASTGRPGEENNTAPPGEDRDLMTGYIDTDSGVNLTTVTVAGLGPEFTGPGYDVIVYITGGVVGRGGEYTIGADVQSHVTSGPFDGTYVLGSEGSYLVFEGLQSESFELTSFGTVGSPMRGPINGVDIVAIPEPASLMLFGLGGMALWRKRRNAS